MQKIIISDTSCLILLEKIDKIIILKKLFGEIIITSEIAREFGKPLPLWIKIVNPKNKRYQNILSVTVDSGEASAIALAIETKNCLLILDDYKARRLASELGLNHTGTIGIFVEAKLLGLIHSIKPVLKKMKHNNFHISKELEKTILKKAKED